MAEPPASGGAVKTRGRAARWALGAGNRAPCLLSGGRRRVVSPWSFGPVAAGVVQSRRIRYLSEVPGLGRYVAIIGVAGMIGRDARHWGPESLPWPREETEHGLCLPPNYGQLPALAHAGHGQR
jgi:hypothetical protein